MAEKWKVIDEYPRYFISNKGRVYSSITNKILSVNPVYSYAYVNLYDDEGNAHDCRVHRLVAKAFVPNPRPDDYFIVGHKDNNKSNNNADNVYWTSTQENTVKAFGDGLAKATVNDGSCIRVGAYDKEGNLVAVYKSMRECARCVDNIDVGYLSKVLKTPSYKPRTKTYKYAVIDEDTYASNILLDGKHLLDTAKMKKQFRMFRAINTDLGINEIWDNQKKFAKKYGLKQGNVSQCLSHGYGYGGWRFMVIEDIDYKDTSGYVNLINVVSEPAVFKNKVTGEAKRFTTFEDAKNFFGLAGNDFRQYLKNNHCVLDKWEYVKQ